MIDILLIALLELSRAQPMAKTVPFTTVARGDLSGIEEAREVVIRTSDEWTRLRKEHMLETLPGRMPAGQMVVGVFLGTRPTGGYAVEIQQVISGAEGFVIQYAERRPSRDAITTQILTTPYHLVSVPAHAGPVRFERIEAPR